MAEFCRQCTEEQGLPGGDYAAGRGDMQGCTTQEQWDQGMAANVICEGCGLIQVDVHGYCISRDCDHPHTFYPAHAPEV